MEFPRKTIIKSLVLLFLLFCATCEANHALKVSGIFNLPNNSTVNGSNSSTYTVSGSISGLSGNLIATLNTSENLSITSNGNFQFTTSFALGSSYSVAISNYPTGQYCSIQNGTGTISGNVTNVLITCQSGNASGPLVGGTVFNTLNLNYNLTTVASGAMFSGINGVTTDGTNIYFTADGNHTILKLIPSTSAVSIIAGQSGISGFADGGALSATFNLPEDLVFLQNILYITDRNNNAIRALDLTTNIVSTFVTGVTSPYGITTDGTYLYLTETGKVSKVNIATATLSVIAGSGVTGYADGVGAAAQFAPQGSINGGIAFDGTDLYLNDRGNCGIRKVVISTGTVTTIAGSPPPTVACGALLDGIGTASRINLADGIASDGTNLYIADTNSCVLRQINMSTLSVTTVAGLNGACSLLDGIGSSARLNNPALMTSDGSTLYISDWGNNAIRKMN